MGRHGAPSIPTREQKMARLQIVQLPATPENPAPYLVVIDDLTPEQADSLPDKTLDMTTIVGCAGALVWGLGLITVPAPMPAPRWVSGFVGTPEDRARLRITLADADEKDAKRPVRGGTSQRYGDLHVLPTVKAVGDE